MENEKFQLQGKSMRILRLNHGIESAELGRQIGLSKSFISMCEANLRRLSEAKTKEFLELIGVSEEDGKEFYKIVGK